jgi:hypothetical protein
MKTLTEYSKNKHKFSLFKREGNFAIFHGKSVDNNSETWEVIEVLSHNGLTMGGVYMEPAEFCPSNNQWGTKGWTCTTQEAAEKRFNKLIQ